MTWCSKLRSREDGKETKSYLGVTSANGERVLIMYATACVIVVANYQFESHTARKGNDQQLHELSCGSATTKRGVVKHIAA